MAPPTHVESLKPLIGGLLVVDTEAAGQEVAEFVSKAQVVMVVDYIRRLVLNVPQEAAGSTVVLQPALSARSLTSNAVGADLFNCVVDRGAVGFWGVRWAEGKTMESKLADVLEAQKDMKSNVFHATTEEGRDVMGPEDIRQRLIDVAEEWRQTCAPSARL
jgi:hypothetical protein